MSRSKDPLRIGIDIMGSDNSPSELLSAAALLTTALPSHIELVAIGSEQYAKSSPLSYKVAEQWIEMGENPLSALRRKKKASLCIGLRLLKEGKLNALVSAGNTGALVSASKMILGTFKGLLRPALLALIPTAKQPLAVLDVGANLQAKATHLVQFAAIGAAYQRACGRKKPRIGILNIGSEPIKGSSELQTAYKKLESFPGFCGNIEGKSAFQGDVDVLIADGFTGNVFLKTAEGTAGLILDRLKTGIPANLLQELHSQLKDLEKQPGALLCGVNGTVVKCHGYSTAEAFANGIQEAIAFASSNFTKLLQQQLEKLRS